MTAIAWRPWSAESFELARTEGKPVLLSLSPSWCRNSLDMDRTSYADPDVAALVNSCFVAIRVDADRRPDIGERYSLGGWPTTAFLTPDGDILGGGTYVERRRLAEVLQRVSDAFAAGRHGVLASRRHASGASAGVPPSLDELIAQVGRSFDAEHGGFGEAPKFPHTAPVRLALDLFKTGGSAVQREMAIISLDAMGWGPLYDERDGGFFRYSQDADWGRPNEEKLLDVNASLLALYVDAFETLELARYVERAEDVLRYLQVWLADPVDAGWAGSQGADAEYYAGRSHGDAAGGATAPPVDRTLYTDWNAAMVSAALKAGRALNEPSLSEFAIRSLERIVLLCYQPGAGMAHYYDGQAQVRGLLDDQVTMAAAHLDAFEATGNVVYEMMAEELALHAAHTLWDGEHGGFFDREADRGRDLGLLSERVKPFAGNCAAARMLRRVGRISKKPAFGDYADRTLAAMAPRAAEQGPLAAEYVLAVRETGQ